MAINDSHEADELALASTAEVPISNVTGNYTGFSMSCLQVDKQFGLAAWLTKWLVAHSAYTSNAAQYNIKPPGMHFSRSSSQQLTDGSAL